MYAPSCNTQVTGKRRKKTRKKAKTLCDAIHPFNMKRKREERFFLLLDRKKTG
jgi:hypothetical protein